MDWRGREEIFTQAELSNQEILDLVEPHFTIHPVPEWVDIWKPVREEWEKGYPVIKEILSDKNGTLMGQFDLTPKNYHFPSRRS